MDDEDVMVIATRSQSQRNPEYNQNINFKNQSITNSSMSFANFRNNLTNKQSSALANHDCKYNIIENLANVKVNATLIDLAHVPEQRKNLENFLASAFVNKSVNKLVDTTVSKYVNKPLGSNFINEEKLTDDPKEILASVQAPYLGQVCHLGERPPRAKWAT